MDDPCDDFSATNNRPAKEASVRKRRYVQLLRRITAVASNWRTLAAAAGLVIAVAPAVRGPSMIVEQIDAPSALADLGYSGDVLARRLRDELRIILTKARPTYLTKLDLQEMSAEMRVPDVEAPIGGVTLRQIVSMGRQFVGLSDYRITGEITARKDKLPEKVDAKRLVEKPKEKTKPKPKDNEDDDADEKQTLYQLKLRGGDGAVIYMTTTPSSEVGALLHEAALAVLERTNPVLVGRYYEANSMFQDAERIAADLVTSTDKTRKLNGLMVRGNTRIRQRRYDDAIADFQSVLEIEPRYALALVNTAWANVWARRWTACVKAADEAIALDEKIANAYAHKAYCQMGLGKYDDALATALSGNRFATPENGQLLGAASRAYWLLKRFDEAEASAREGVRRDPALHTALRHLGAALQAKGDIAGALDYYKKALAADPAYSWNSWAVAQAQYELGRYKEALPFATQAREMEPGAALPWMMEALILAKLNRNEEAVAAWEKAASIDPKVRGDRAPFARSYLALKKYKQADELFSQGQVDERKAPTFWIGWLTTLRALKQNDRIFEVLQKSVKEAVPNAELEREFGLALVKRKRDAEALQHLDLAIQLDSRLKAKLSAVIARLKKKAQVTAVSNVEQAQPAVISAKR